MSATARQRAILADYLLARRESLDLKSSDVAARCRRLSSWYRNIERGARASISRTETELLEKALELEPGTLNKRAQEAGY